jgi:hypothetical protein
MLVKVFLDRVVLEKLLQKDRFADGNSAVFEARDELVAVHQIATMVREFRFVKLCHIGFLIHYSHYT